MFHLILENVNTKTFLQQELENLLQVYNKSFIFLLVQILPVDQSCVQMLQIIQCSTLHLTCDYLGDKTMYDGFHQNRIFVAH